MTRLLSGILAAGALTAPAVADAAEIVVTTSADERNTDGDCSLREAIQAANTDVAVDACVAGAGADIIALAEHDVVLTMVGAGEDANASGDLDVSSVLTIIGAGFVDGNASDRVFHVRPAGHLTLLGLSIQRGLVTGEDGGGVRNDGTLVLDGVTVRDNEARGATASDAGGGHGGAIYNLGNLAIRDSFLWDNRARGGNGGNGVPVGGGGGGGAGLGGALYNDDGIVTIEGSELTGNRVFGGEGGDGGPNNGNTFGTGGTGGSAGGTGGAGGIVGVGGAFGGGGGGGGSSWSLGGGGGLGGFGGGGGGGGASTGGGAGDPAGAAGLGGGAGATGHSSAAGGGGGGAGIGSAIFDLAGMVTISSSRIAANVGSGGTRGVTGWEERGPAADGIAAVYTLDGAIVVEGSQLGLNRGTITVDCGATGTGTVTSMGGNLLGADGGCVAAAGDLLDLGDFDADGIGNDDDNCPIDANAAQVDTDGDGDGDACDAVIDGDYDADGVADADDNCAVIANTDQADGDDDGLGDACDPTDDDDDDTTPADDDDGGGCSAGGRTSVGMLALIGLALAMVSRRRRRS